MIALRKLLGTLARPGAWSGMAWGVVLMIGLCVAATAFIGVQLYEITDQQPGFSTQ